VQGTLKFILLVAVATLLSPARSSDEPSSVDEEQSFRIVSMDALGNDDSLSTFENPQYSVYSKDVGWDGIDLVITEVERTDSSSLLNVPDYAERTAMKSRFVMCAFSQLTLLRGFTHWVLSIRPATDSDSVRVGFHSESPNDKKTPGASDFAGMCQFFDPHSGETSNKSLNTDPSRAGAG